MTDRLAEKGALAYAAENAATASTSPNRLGGAGYLHAAYAEYQTWAAANPNTNPSRLSAKGRLFGYFYDNASWSPSALFTAGEQGAWYDPSDLSTMFQDAAGTTPVTAVEQPVGLVLDKSKGLVLGSELVTNGDFNNGTTGWVGTRATLSAPSSELIITSTDDYGIGASTGFATTIGKMYKATARLVGCSSATARIRKTDSQVSFNSNPEQLINGPTWTPGQVFTVYFVATATTSYIMGVTDLHPSSITIDNVSVKELPGNHASQSTTTKRPILRQDAGGKYYLAFDGVDDSLITADVLDHSGNYSAFAGVLNAVSAWPAGIFSIRGATSDTEGMICTLVSSDQSNRLQLRAYSTTAMALQVLNTSTPHVLYLAKDNINHIREQSIDGVTNSDNSPFAVTPAASVSVPLRVGLNFSSQYYLGRIYSLIVRGALSTADEIAATEAWVANKTGVTL